MGATSNYPGSLDTTSTLPADISATAALNSPNHAQMHERYNDAIIEIEEKVGIGDTTPTSGAILIGTGTGQSAWDTTPTFEGTVTVGGVVDITDTTDSSDATGDTGALRCEGGASIAKKLYVGTDLDVDGTTNLDVVDVDGQLTLADGSSGAPAMAFGSDTDAGIYRSAADKVGIAGHIEMNTELATFTTGGYATPRRLDNGETDGKQLKELVSSERFKKDIVDLPKEEAYKILNARPIKYRGIDDSSSVPLEAGLSAESLHEAGYEYAVRYDEGHWGETPRNIYYDMLVAPLIAIVKDLNNRLEALEG